MVCIQHSPPSGRDAVSAPSLPTFHAFALKALLPVDQISGSNMSTSEEEAALGHGPGGLAAWVLLGVFIGSQTS